MREKEPTSIEPARPEAPDEIIPVEDYGAKITVEVWHSTTPPTLRTTFSYEASPDQDAVSYFQAKPDTKRWIRNAEYYTLYRKAYLAGLCAISLYQAAKNPETDKFGNQES
jgi:hypothetical protein